MSAKQNIYFNYSFTRNKIPVYWRKHLTYFKIRICQNQITANMVKKKQLLDDFAVSFGKGEKKIQCNICEKTFSSKNSVKRHIGSIHEGKKPHQCEIKSVYKRMFLYKCPLYDHSWPFFLPYACILFTKLRFWWSFSGA